MYPYNVWCMSDTSTIKCWCVYVLCTMYRPHLDDEIKEKVEAVTAGKFAVQESKVSFNNRMEKFLELYAESRHQNGARVAWEDR